MTYPAIVCGDNPFFSPASEGGCGQPIVEERTSLYRCAYCHIPFHAECIRRHIENEPPPKRHAESEKGADPEAHIRWLISAKDAETARADRAEGELRRHLERPNSGETNSQKR